MKHKLDILIAAAAAFNPESRAVQLALANSADATEALVLENLIALDNEGWALLAPYGEHRKERVAMVNGKPQRQAFIQVVDEQAVTDLLANEQGGGVWQKIKRALIKRPVFKGHPDLKQHAPDSLDNHSGPAIPIGLVAANRKGPRGLEARFDLTEEGATAVENEGCKYPSALWLVKPTGETRDGAIVMRPFKILSVGLTATPNISGVDSLANAKPNTPAAEATQQNQDTMKQLIIGWLAAQSIAVANDATDQVVLDAINKAYLGKAGEVTALGNEKATLSTQATALQNEKAALTTERDQLKTQLSEKTTALENTNTALANERKDRITARVDLAIAQGKLAIADRETKITALGNSTTLDAELAALDKLPVKFAIGNTAAGVRKADANTETRTPRDRILSLANADERYKDLPFDRAYAQILADHPDLAAAIKQPAAA